MEYHDEVKILRSRHYAMLRRCYNKNSADYKNYGGRGITVCNEWKELKGFIKWAFVNGWQLNLQIDRINNNLGYYPENCRFVISKINSQNQRKSKRWHIEGKVFNSSTEAAKYFNINSGQVWVWCHGHRTKWSFCPRKPNCWVEKLY